MLETEYAYYRLDAGILMVEYKSMAINYEVAKSIVEQRKKNYSGMLYPTLVDIRQVRSLNQEARRFFQSQEARMGLSAAALLVNSIHTTIIGNFFLQGVFRVSKSFPSKIFNDRQKAIQWLKKYTIK